MDCPTKEDLVEERIDRILTHFREAPNLLAMIRHDLGQIADAALAACAIPSKFDILTAVGDQLTILGKRLGFPRCHCICNTIPVFGFACEGAEIITVDGVPVTFEGDIVTTEGEIGTSGLNKPLGGFCSGAVWDDCRETGTIDICIDDDETYRSYLLARRYQIRRLWDIDSLQASVTHIWGETATAVCMGGARLAIKPGRDLTATEQQLLPVSFRVLPIAPGITPYISYETGAIFGFGDGWGGFCDGSTWLCPEEFDPYNCAA